MASKKEVEVNDIEEAKETANKIIADANALVEKMLADAEKKIAEKIAKVGVSTTTTNPRELVIRRNKKTSQHEEEVKEYMEEKVPFYAMKDNDKYKDDIFVSVNGENCIIKRGEQVMIKRKFYEVLKNSDKQDMKTYELMESFNKKF